MPSITINRVPAEVLQELKQAFGSRSAYAKKALAAQLTKDGRGDLAKRLKKTAAN